MREGTSGFWVERKKGELRIGYVDFGVSQFGGGDFEKTYYLNRENAKRLKRSLRKEHRGSLENMLEAAFGRGFDDARFWEFCKQNGIEYTSSTWSG